MNYYSDKVAWVTGASSGIGEALVYELARQGATVIASARNAKKLEEVQSNCNEMVGNCDPVVLDLEDQNEFQSLAKRVIEKHAKIDLLIHVSGISQRSVAADTELMVTRRIIEVNFFGTVALNQAVLPYMIRQGFGQIAVTSSIVGKFGFSLRSAYSASKHALHGYFESLRAETWNQNIKVSILIPGRINTAISNNALTGDGSAWGRLDQGQASGLTAEKCAKKILRGLRKGRREILVGGKELIMVHLKRYLPAIFWKLATRVSPT